MNGRYTISRHDHPDGIHFDLFLEDRELLATWRLSDAPETGAVHAERIADHRTIYLDYEGEVSGGRGSVRIHSTGLYSLVENRLTLDEGASAGAYELQEENLLVRLDG